MTLQSKDQTQDQEQLDPRYGRIMIRDQSGAMYPTETCYEGESTATVSQDRRLQEEEQITKISGYTRQTRPNQGRSLDENSTVAPVRINYLRPIFERNESKLKYFKLDIQDPETDPENSYRTYHISTAGLQLQCDEDYSFDDEYGWYEE